MTVNDDDPSLQDLNPPQREAVLHGDGPLLVLAGAGSGKTRVITRRIAHLYRQGLDAEEVLAITFTNKAAGEMRGRTEQLCGVRSRWISTFHSLGARLLRRHARHVPPYDASFTIYDPADCRALLKEILRAHSLDDEALWTVKGLEKEISRIKNEHGGEPKDQRTAEMRWRVLHEVYDLYRKELQNRNAVDFDDLLLLPLRLLEENDGVRERYQEQFRHVLVDEYQDTNSVQYRLTKLLGARYRNICVTGDPDQSIYRWRGADLNNILNFERDYPEAKIVRLEQNYRSTQSILDTANVLISHNTQRRPKTLWTDMGAGDAVGIERFDDERMEAEELVRRIEELRRDGRDLRDIAILYRINALSRTLEQRLMFNSIPFSVVGGVAFYVREEVKDILAYLQALANPRDAESVKRILNTPARGIGRSTLEKLTGEADHQGRTLLEIVLEADLSFLPKRSTGAVTAFRELYRELESLTGACVAELVRGVIERTGYAAHLRKRFPLDYRERLLNVEELVSAALDFDRERFAAERDGEGPEGSASGLVGFLEQARLLGDIDRWEDEEDRVTLMTLHSAKGLEFPIVFIIAIEEGILPLQRDDKDELEEERRLLYVGLTRAQERLHLSHVRKRLRFGDVRPAYPSLFLRELIGTDPNREPGSHLWVDTATWRSLVDEPSDRLRTSRRWWRSGGSGSDAWIDEYFGDDLYLDEDPYPPGSRIYHDDYGEGTVARVSRVGRRLQVTVDFDEAGQKNLLPEMTLLRRIR